MQTLVSGSVSYDIIMTHDGKFSDGLSGDVKKNLNVSFVIDTKEKEFGGAGGNIAYNLGLLGEGVDLYSRAGRDFADYEEWLIENSVNTDNIKIHEDIDTSIAYVTTDAENNQITSFYPGAMLKKDKFRVQDPGRYSLAIIAPESIEWMTDAIHTLASNVPFIFDPGHHISQFKKSDLIKGVTYAEAIIVNEDSLTELIKKTGFKLEEIIQKVPHLIVTQGHKGSTIYNLGREIKIGIAKPKHLIDTTGAGDAYRAGIMTGMSCGFDWELTGELAATAASFAIEELGTQNHYFDLDDFSKRLFKNFGKTLNLEDF